MSEPAQATPPEFSIELRSHQVTPGFGPIPPAVHNEIVFLHNGKPVMSFDGDPYNRVTGELTPTSLSGKDTLRVRAIEGMSMAEFAKDYPQLNKAVLFEGSKEKFLELMGRATEAAEHINKQNMDYIIIGVGFTAQNSNSVAHSLTQAMGLEYPQHIKDQFMPGHGRQLLPDNFRSQFQGLGDVQGWMDDPKYEGLGKALVTKLNALNEAKVGEQVRNDPNPYAQEYDMEGRPVQGFKLHDPKKAVPSDAAPAVEAAAPPPMRRAPISNPGTGM